MPYYFGSSEQQKADNYYNKKKYEQALKYYLQALQKLNQKRISQPSLKQDLQFSDAHCYLITDILITQSQLIKKFVADSKRIPTSVLLEQILGFAQTLQSIRDMKVELEESWSLVYRSRSRLCKSETINDAYELIAQSLELLSDLAFASAEESTQQDKNYLLAMNFAIEAMENAMDYKRKIDIKMHCGYLNLLDQLYKDTKDPAYLIKMKNHISKFKLQKQKGLDWPTELELISYILLADTNHKELRDKNLIARGWSLVSSLSAEAEENNHELIITEFKNLVKEESEKRTSPGSYQSLPDSSLPLKKRRTPELQSTKQSDIEAIERWQDLVDGDHGTQVTLHQNSVPASSSTSFFSPLIPQVSTPKAAVPKTELFRNAITAIEKDKRLKSNILALIGEYCTKIKADKHKRNSMVIIAESLFLTALSIDPTNRSAKALLTTLRANNVKMFKYLDHYGFHRSQSRESTFEEQLDGFCENIETLNLTHQEDIPQIMDGLFKFLSHQIERYHLMPTRQFEKFTKIFNQETESLDQAKSSGPLSDSIAY